MLFASKKVVTVGKVSDFVNAAKEVENSVKVEKIFSSLPYISIPFLVPHLAGFQPIGGSYPVMAHAASSVPVSSVKEEVSQKIIEAFQPIIDLVQGLAYPIAFISISIAGVKWMLRDREGALATLQGSAMGFVIVQMSPLIMKLLVSVTAGF
ncbi:MAG TPA: hypothetical protein VNM45_21115 [Bacillus sp. (in: firmicutes)]|nr:hypothetical protein [Bacillus sp. (in: firmicutes)]